MKPTIYLVHYLSKPGGLEILMPTIIKELKGWDVKVFVIRPIANMDLGVYKDVQVEITYGSKITFFALIKFFIFILIDRKGIYHLFNVGPYFLFILRLLRVKKIIYSIHGTVYWRTKFQKLIRKCIWQLAATKKVIFTANSNYSADVFKESVIRNSNPLTLYNPIDTEKFNLKGRSEGQISNKIIFVGRLVNGKNFEKWISVVTYLLKSKVDATFEIYGTGPYESELQKQIQASGFGEKIILKGYKKEIEEVYKSADLLLFLSGYESFGNVVVESVLCGTPVITFDIPSMKEIFEKYLDFLVQNNEQYQERIYDKVKSISELKNLAIKASSDFSQRFNSTTHINKLESIYNGFA